MEGLHKGLAGMGHRRCHPRSGGSSGMIALFCHPPSPSAFLEPRTGGRWVHGAAKLLEVHAPGDDTHVELDL